MYMSEQEIIRNYKESKNKRMQVEILSGLNNCEKSEIKEILIRNKVLFPTPERKKGNKVEWDKEISTIKKMREEGKRLKEIAKVYGVTDVTISKIIRKYKRIEELESIKGLDIVKEGVRRSVHITASRQAV